MSETPRTVGRDWCGAHRKPWTDGLTLRQHLNSATSDDARGSGGDEGICLEAPGVALPWPIARLARIKNPVAPAGKREAEDMEWGR
jgi:hypothetical protein